MEKNKKVEEVQKVEQVKKIAIPTPRTMWSNTHGFICKSGNGKKVLQYEIGKEGVPVIQKDENGKPVYFNFYETIQKFAKSNDYKKFLQMNGDPALLEDDGSQFIDATKAGSLEDVLNARARVANSGKSVEDIYKEFIEKMNGVLSKDKKSDEVKVEKKVSDPVDLVKKPEQKQEKKEVTNEKK
ncbi:MAG: hypothetical protein KBS35_03235 [Mycoplasma sp.]|nr:hypothetical protein [Candidatus Hennigella equi]